MGARAGETFGEFLRASRARLEPADVGFANGGSRRVSGLRREEVAVLAGVSADYYARLEQGRERSPSAQVVDAIGQALRLGPDARIHLQRLAGLSLAPASSESRDVVHPDLRQLLDSFPVAAAYVLSPAFEILASNAIAAALLSPFHGTTNMVRVLFQHPKAKQVFVEWEAVAHRSVRVLRLNAGLYPADTAIRSLVDEFLQISHEFRSVWEDQTVESMTRSHKVFLHPQVGRIELTYQSFDVRDVPGQQLLVGMPEPGTSSADALAILGSLHANL